METKKGGLLVEVAIFFAIVLLFFALPPVGSITTGGMRLIGLFIAFIYGMTITTDPWPALFTVVLFPATGLVDMASVLTTGFGSDIFVFVLFSLVLVEFLQQTGASAFVATWLLRRRFLVGRPWRLLAMLLFVCWLISAFVNAVAGLMITWSFIYEIFDKFGYKPREKTSTLVMFGTCIVAALGLASLPWGNNSLVILQAYTNFTGGEVDYLIYMAFSIPYALMTIVVYLLACRFIFRVDVSAMESYDPAMFQGEALTLTFEKKAALLAMVALVLLILVPTLLPATSPIAAISKSMGLSGKLLAIFAVLQVIKHDGKRFFSFAALAKDGTNWKLMLLVADILVFSSVIGADGAGIATFLNEALSPVFSGQPQIFLIVVATIACVVLTNFMVNKIVGVMILTITLPIASTMGMDLVQLAALFTVAATVAFMLPSASQASTVFFANSEWARPKDIFKYGMVMIVIMTAMLIVWSVALFSIL